MHLANIIDPVLGTGRSQRKCESGIILKCFETTLATFVCSQVRHVGNTIAHRKQCQFQLTPLQLDHSYGNIS